MRGQTVLCPNWTSGYSNCRFPNQRCHENGAATNNCFYCALIFWLFSWFINWLFGKHRHFSPFSDMFWTKVKKPENIHIQKAEGREFGLSLFKKITQTDSFDCCRSINWSIDPHRTRQNNNLIDRRAASFSPSVPSLLKSPTVTEYPEEHGENQSHSVRRNLVLITGLWVRVPQEQVMFHLFSTDRI